MANTTAAPAVKATEQVIVEGKPLDQTKVDPALDFASSHMPYHTKATEKIAVARAKELKGQKDKPYEYKFNGYTVTEVDAPNPAATDEDDKDTLYKVKADDAPFEQFFTNQRAAEIFVETHSPQFAKNAQVTNKTAVKDIPKT